MKLVIEIRDEIAVDFKKDKFLDFFERVMADMNCVCGNYEKEIAEELIKAFNNAKEIQ